jgi:hypothetical protein
MLVEVGGQSILVSGSHLEPMTKFFVFRQTVEGFLMWGALSEERMGLKLTRIIASGPYQRNHSRVQVPQKSRPYFTVSYEIPPTWRARSSYLCTPGTRWPHTICRATVEIF